jgi:uncharacterized membrane protein YgcG
MHECVTDVTDNLCSDLISIKRYGLALRTFVRVINDRINWVWNSRDTNLLPTGASVRIVEASKLYYDIQHTSTAFKSIILKFSGSCTNPIKLLRHVVEVVLPAFQRRVESFLRSYSREALNEPLKQYITKHPQVFLVQWKRHSSAVSTFMRLLSTCTAGNDDSKSSANLQARSEQELFELIRCFAVDPVWKPFVLVRLEVKPAHIAAMALNSALVGFLQYIVAAGCQFDELGVYKLYRVLLTEYISALKKEFGVPVSERLIQVNTEWRRAEAILQILNNAVFEKSTRPDSNKSSNKSSSGGRASNSTTSGNVGSGSGRGAASVVPGTALNPSGTLLSASDTARWQALATAPPRGILPRGSRRQKGTIFITLELNVDNL